MKYVSNILATLAAVVALNSSSEGQTPHPEDAGKNSEHLAMLAIVPESAATHVVANSGNWSTPGTWTNGTLPTNGSRVLIPTGKSVTVDGVLATRVKWIRVNGTLNFSPTVNTELKVDSLVVDPAGSLLVGTPTEPIGPNVSARIVYIDDGEIDRSWDPVALSRGLISHGLARVFGNPTTAYGTLAQPARKGNTVLQLQSAPLGWKVGGRLVLPSVIRILDRNIGGTVSDNEEFTITAINNTSVTLNRPLTFDHVPPFQIPMVAAYLDRNVTFISENFATKRRGHTMFMHSANVQIADALFEQLGRTSSATEVTDPIFDASGNLLPTKDSKGNTIPVSAANDRGRYALHFHRTIPNSSRIVSVKRVCVVNSPKLGFVNHDSNVECEDSVVYDAAGAGFFTEVGSEIGSLKRCVAIHTMRGVGRLEERGTEGDALPNGTDFSHEGNGFWFQGGGVAITDCMSFESRVAGFALDTIPLKTSGGLTRFDSANLENPAWAQGATQYDSQSVPLRMFRNNISVNAEMGILLRKHIPSARRSLIEDSKFVNCAYIGIHGEYGQNKVFQNCLVHGGTTAMSGQTPWLWGMGVWGFKDDNVNRSPIFDNVTFLNFQEGLHTGCSGILKIRNSSIDAIIGVIAAFDTEIVNTVFPKTVRLMSPQEGVYMSFYRDFHLEHIMPGSFTFKADGVNYPYPTNLDSSVDYNQTSATIPVRITTQPRSQIATAGASATFSTGATGTGNLSYQWYLNDTPLAGATSPSLTVPSIGVSQLGIYSARVSSSAGSADTQYALLSLGATAAPTAPALTAAASRKQHGVFGTFDLPLALSGTPTVEPRLTGDTLTLLLTFSAPISAATPAITAGQGAVSSSSVNGNQLLVNINGVTPLTTLALAVNNVTGTNGGVLPTASVTLALLPSDGNGDRVVNVVDIALTKLGTSVGVVNSSNFKLDTNVDGLINGGDISFAKVRSGTLVP